MATKTDTQLKDVIADNKLTKQLLIDVVDSKVNIDSNITSGTYTPTLTDDTNISSSSPFLAQWMRIGDVVTVSGRVSFSTTATGSATLGISLPVASTISGVEDVAGVSAVNHTAIQGTGSVIGDSVNNRASIQLISSFTDFVAYSYTFTYKIL